MFYEKLFNFTSKFFFPDSPTASPLNELIAEDVTEMNENPLLASRNRRSAESATNKFRPLRLTEMMHFCCRYGCSFRDLLPYCDPFGQWDS
uniref:Insulin-like domain-containing protein n=1 Tax=Panagrolaimus sp. ES5 TaxID=591445 RepID=A0AC34FKT9_9BILA